MSWALAIMAVAASASPQWPAMSKSRRVEFIQSVGDTCKLPRSAFVLNGKGDLEFEPPEQEYEPAMCGARALIEAHAVKRIGFITEPPASKKKN